MPAPSTSDEFLDLIRKSGVLDEKRLDAYLDKARATSSLPSEPSKLAGLLVRDAILTHFQAEQFLQGKWRRFTIGKYKVLERIGSGGMGSVYLCEHKLMRRRVAVKVLPTAKADDTSSLERFYREARAVAALDHVNIVRAYDIDQDDKLHFLVMEYVDGASLQEMVKRGGPLDPIRAAHYMRQAAQGLQHAHDCAGLVHRDIKPGNILVDRTGVVKVLDMGLARFFFDEEDVLTKKYDENVLGTADYLAPEQALDSHSVDIRADIYSLGATFYYCLTGRSPFNEGTVAQKLIWHQTRQPKPIRSINADVPEGLVAIIEQMMSKDPAQRYPTPQAVVDVLAPWTQQPIAPPPEKEMPHLSPAAMGVTGSGEMASLATPNPSQPVPGGPSSKRNWQVPTTQNPKPPANPRPPSDMAPPVAPAPSKQAAPVALPLRPSVSPSPAPARPRANGDLPGTLPRGPNARPTSPRANPVSAPRGAVTTAPQPEPIAEEESPPWEQLSPDTDDLTARADTAPRSAHKRVPAPKQSKSKALLEDPKKRRILWIILAVICFFALAGATAVISSAFFGKSKSKTSGEDSPPALGKTLFVRQDGAYRKISEALKDAQPGDHIRVGVNVQENVLLEGKRFQSLTIESEDSNRPVTWSFPTDAKGVAQILDIRNVEGVTVRGFVMDGGDRANEIVRLYGNCPGLKLDDLKLKGFKQYGIVVSNCAGTSDRPVTLSRLRFFGDEKLQRDAAIRFQFVKAIVDPPLNRFIKVQSCSTQNSFKERYSIDPAGNDATVELEQ
jgi:eukaryotic-like serine/threonine-protein kinase